MLIIRTALVLGVGVLFLPTDEKQQAKLYGTASYAVERASGFCDRNPQTCRQGAELWATFVKKAEFGGRMALDLISDRGRAGPQPAIQPADTRGTLRPNDLEPRWRGAQQRAGA